VLAVWWFSLYVSLTCLSILGPSLDAKAKFMSFNRTQSRSVTGFLTGHNTLRRHLHLLGLLDSPLCRRCGVKEETSAHMLCECEALAPLRHAYLGSFFLEPEDIKSMSLGSIWNFSKSQGSHDLTWGTKGLLFKAWVHRDHEVLNPYAIYLPTYPPTHLPTYLPVCHSIIFLTICLRKEM
jgi:hypothetical protein